MTAFFGDAPAFCRELKSRAVPDGRCWCCHDTALLTSLNVSKDLGTLGLSAQGCPQRIGLCPPCAVQFINSFNAALNRQRGKQDCPCCQWTVERFLEMRRAGQC